MKYASPNGMRDMNEKEYECFLEGMAYGIWRTALSFDGEGHCKMYDPLLIEGKTAHSYVFDFTDGGRHHDFKNLEEVFGWLEKEAENTAKYISTENK